MEFVTAGWILEYLIHLVKLGLVVVFDEVDHRFANVLDVLVTVTERSNWDGVDSLVDGIGAVVPVQNSCDASLSIGLDRAKTIVRSQITRIDVRVIEDNSNRRPHRW